MTTSISKTIKDLTNDQTKHCFAKNDVYFALKLIGPTPEKLLDPTILLLEFIKAATNKVSNSDGYVVSWTQIEYEYWENKFKSVNQEKNDRLELPTYLWPKNTDFFIWSNYSSY